MSPQRSSGSQNNVSLQQDHSLTFVEVDGTRFPKWSAMEYIPEEKHSFLGKRKNIYICSHMYKACKNTTQHFALPHVL